MEDELIIKILEFVCKNKGASGIPAARIKKDLFPEFDLNKIEHLFNEIEKRRIYQITVAKGNRTYLKYKDGLEDYVKDLKKMTKKEKLHRIVEFLSTEKERLNKDSFNSGQIAKAFTPELDISEVNTLCRILISNRDVRDCTTKDESGMGMVAA
jgi:hypothetical protein